MEDKDKDEEDEGDNWIGLGGLVNMSIGWRFGRLHKRISFPIFQ